MSAPKALEIHELRIPAKRFKSLPDVCRQTLLRLGHALNELNVTRNIFILAANAQDIRRPDNSVLSSQGAILLRLLLAKVHEAIRLFRELNKVPSISRILNNAPTPEMEVAIKWFKQHESRKTVTSRTRNTYAFHIPRGVVLDEAFLSGNEDDWLLYMGRTRSNLFSPSSDDAVTSALLLELHPTVHTNNAVELFSRSMEEALSDHEHIANLLHAALVILINHYCPEIRVSKAFDLDRPISRSAMKLPFFFAEDEG